jgi:pantoate--beta-alanine ligase
VTRVFRDLESWFVERDRLSLASVKGPATLGFVPTMGALHAGHISLIERSRRENDFTLVSIFVNPTQFNDPKDLEKYPRTFESDLKMLEEAGADFLLYPDYNSLYPDHYRYKLQENELSRHLCGAHRPGHFDGVLSVVMKLLNIAGADRAYFGEKDYQQYLLIRGMAEAFFLRTRVIGCPTLREEDGLAMSSRNILLSPAERQQAVRFPEILNSPASLEEARKKLEEAGFAVDYVEECFARRFGAVRLGAVRLIDNFPVKGREKES